MRPSLQGFFGTGVAARSFKNSDFLDLANWTVFNTQVKLNGLSMIGRWPTPNDNKLPSHPVGDNNTISGFTFTNTLSSADLPPGYSAPQNALVLQNYGTVGKPYGIVHGPAVISDQTIHVETGGSIRFWWRGLAGGDAYDIYAYLLNVDNGTTIELLNETGPDDTGVTQWALKTVAVPAGINGEYKFVFIAGSYDFTGGQAVGGKLLITGINGSAVAPMVNSVTAAVDPVNEGDTATISINYANFSGETVFWNVSVPGGVTASNFTGATAGSFRLSDSGTATININPIRYTSPTTNWTYGIHLGSASGLADYYDTTATAFHVNHRGISSARPTVDPVTEGNSTTILASYSGFTGQTVSWLLKYTTPVTANNFTTVSGNIVLTGSGTYPIDVYPLPTSTVTANWSYGIQFGSTVNGSDYYSLPANTFHVTHASRQTGGLTKVIVVWDPASVGNGRYTDDVNPGTDIFPSISGRESVLGYDAVLVSSYADLLTTDLTTCSHIWDVGYDTVITTEVQTKYTSFLSNGGALFLLGENASGFIDRDNSIVSTIVAAGGGSVTVKSDFGNPQFTETIASEFLLANQSNTVGFNGVGSFNTLGSGTNMITGGLGRAEAVMWKTGSLTNARKGAIISVLDINFFVGGNYQPNFIDNLVVCLNKK